MKNLFNKIMELVNNIFGVINNVFKIFKSKRALMTTIITMAWFIFGIKGINNGIDMSEFAAYFAALSPFVIGYIYGETKRPSGCEKCK